MISIILLILLITVLLVSLMFYLLFRSQGKFTKRILCFAVPLLSCLFIVAMIVEKYHQRAVQEKELDTMNGALNYTLKNRLFESDEERLLCIDSLYQYKQQINDIAQWDSVISVFLGKDSTMIYQIDKTESIIIKQIKRYSILNEMDSANYSISSTVPGDFNLIEPDNTQLPVLNVAFVLSQKSDSASLAMLMLALEDSVCFQQSYKLKEGVNAFLFPNMFNKGAELRVGYLKDNKESKTFYCKKYKPNV